MSRNDLGQFTKDSASDITKLRRTTARDRKDTQALADCGRAGRFGRKPNRKRDRLQWQQAKFLKAYIRGDRTLDQALLEQGITRPRFANWLTDPVFAGAYDATLLLLETENRSDAVFAQRHAPAACGLAPLPAPPPALALPAPTPQLPAPPPPPDPGLSALQSARRDFHEVDLPELRAAGVDPSDPAAVKRWLDDRRRAQSEDDHRAAQSRYRQWARANRAAFEANNDLATWERIVNEPDAPKPV